MKDPVKSYVSVVRTDAVPVRVNVASAEPGTFVPPTSVLLNKRTCAVVTGVSAASPSTMFVIWSPAVPVDVNPCANCTFGFEDFE